MTIGYGYWKGYISETNVVIIIDIDADTFKDDNSKCVFYVASSRAKHCLTYIAMLNDEDLSKMVADLGEDPGNNSKKMLSDLLNIKIQEID